MDNVFFLKRLKKTAKNINNSLQSAMKVRRPHCLDALKNCFCDHQPRGHIYNSIQVVPEEK